jgi:hypothetical protein
MSDIKKIAKDLYHCCRNAQGAYSMLKTLGANKHLPGYGHCVSRLEKAIQQYVEWEMKR